MLTHPSALHLASYHWTSTTRYSFGVVSMLCGFVKVLPSTLTENQKVTILQKDLPQLSREDIKDLLSFVINELSDTISSFTANRVIILVPPVEHCYDCQQPLSSYSLCQVKCYTTNGAVECQKFTLRCTKRKLLYNYAQFGNKTWPWFSVLSTSAWICGSIRYYLHREEPTGAPMFSCIRNWWLHFMVDF